MIVLSVPQLAGMQVHAAAGARFAFLSAAMMRTKGNPAEQIAFIEQAGATFDEALYLLSQAGNYQPPAPTAYDIEDLIAGSVGLHAGTICGVAGYDWEKHGVIQSPSPSGSQMTAWGVANWDCGKHVAGVRFELRNPRGYALANGKWVQLTDEVSWVATMNPQTNQFGGPAVGSGPVFTMPNGPYSIHFGSAKHASLPAGTVGVASLFEARLSAGPEGRLMIGSGADYWSGAGNVGAVVGQYRFLTYDWAWYGAASASAAALRAAGLPPLP